MLGLTGNQLASFPEEILSLESLEKLYIGQDQGAKLTYMPEDISKLQVSLPKWLGKEVHAHWFLKLADTENTQWCPHRLHVESSILDFQPPNKQPLFHSEASTVSLSPWIHIQRTFCCDCCWLCCAILLFTVQFGMFHLQKLSPTAFHLISSFCRRPLKIILFWSSHGWEPAFWMHQRDLPSCLMANKPE